MNAVQGLKLLAAVMGVLIIAAIGLLGYGVYSKLDGGGKAGPAVPATDGPQAPVSGLSPVASAPQQPASQDTPPPVSLDQPAGSRIADATTAGSLLTLRIEGGELPDRVAVVDLATGRVAAWVHIGSAR